MRITSTHPEPLDRIADQLRLAPAPNPELVNAAVVAACTRLRLLSRTGKAAELQRLIQAGAWADLALAVIAIELPGWRLRRLVYDGGAWLCSLSRHPEMPLDLDDTADGSHDDATLAIWTAFIEARRRSTESARQASVPQVSAAAGLAICCENFS